MKILITGAAGFIGYHLAKHILESGHHELVLTDNFFRGKRDEDFASLLEKPNVSFLELDLADPASVEKLGEQYDHVYHLAAVNGTQNFYEMPAEVLRVNTLALIHVLDWFAKKSANGKILFTSSSEVYAGAIDIGFNLPLPTPEGVPLVVSDPYNPRWSYGATKIIGEAFLIHYANRYNFRGVIVRPHNFYGPRDKDRHVIPDFIARVLSKTDPFPIYGAKNTRSFCYIEDAVQAMRFLMESTKTDTLPVDVFHVGSEQDVPMDELAQALFSAAEWSPSSIEEHPAPEGSTLRRGADTSKIRERTGWVPKTPIEEGLRKTLEWHRRISE